MNFNSFFFYKNILTNEKDSIIMWLKLCSNYNVKYGILDNYIMLQYKSGHLAFLNPVGVPEDLKEKILVKDKELYCCLAKYGIINYFNIDPMINTISNQFKVNIFDNCFSINLNDEEKLVKLYYPYIEEKNKKLILTQFGSFVLDTNVFGIEGLFSNKKYQNNTENFLSHLKIYETDLPEYLRKDKIKRI